MANSLADDFAKQDLVKFLNLNEILMKRKGNFMNKNPTANFPV